MEISDLVYIDENGYFFADYPTFLQFITEKYQGIYGVDVYLEDDSQDGQFLAILAKSFFDMAAQGAAVYNSFSPSTAQGVGLSRNVKINGISRRIPTFSTATLAVVGTAGTVISNGVAEDTLGQKWDLPASVTIPGGGSTNVTATSQTAGAVNAAANTINKIFTPTQGWQTVNNASASTPGEPVETDSQLRARQQQSTALPSQTVLDGIAGAVANLTGVVEVKPYENDTGSTDSNGLPEHSICLVVAGGDDTEICETIALKKTPGCDTFGDVTELVYDSRGMPLSISFQRPVNVTIEAEITLAAGVGWSTDYIDLIKTAVSETIAAFPIGSTILLSKLYAPAYLNGSEAGDTYDIASIEICISGDPLAAANIPLTFQQRPICTNADISVVVT